MSLNRFHEAQNKTWCGYATALDEMRAGRKSSHWIWYIFPQIAGLGHSSTARHYALEDFGEACAYLRDPLLRQRYEEIASAVAGHISRGAPLEHLMGSEIDASKLVSSVTLFRAAATRLAETEPASDLSRIAALCESILDRAGAQGCAPCAFTLERCAS
jgi:uncharacterized protein (DUF1810 family)